MEMTINQIKSWKEQIGAKHIIVFAIDEDGEYLFGHQGDKDKPLLIKDVIAATKEVIDIYNERRIYENK